VLCGTEDKITPPALSDELAGLITGARIETIQNAGHLTNLEQPGEFNRIVGTFIRAVDSGAA
jgi:3-oxoadipate enol-lactonase